MTLSGTGALSQCEVTHVHKSEWIASAKGVKFREDGQVRILGEYSECYMQASSCITLRTTNELDE